MERNKHTVRFKYLRHVFKSKGEVLRMLRGIRVNGDLKGLPYDGVHHCGRTHLPWGHPWGKLLKKKKKKKKIAALVCHLCAVVTALEMRIAWPAKTPIMKYLKREDYETRPISFPNGKRGQKSTFSNSWLESERENSPSSMNSSFLNRSKCLLMCKSWIKYATIAEFTKDILESKKGKYVVIHRAGEMRYDDKSNW